ncbi:MAG: hypothetical protein M1816_002544 [Peltula sp. TS41687]|nr:MAG: hypothetical protein M1816_002544 [Peltula sp. TS41687]
MVSKESRDRLAANSAWYRYVAKNAKPVYCQRNIKTVLEYYGRRQPGDGRPTGGTSSEHPTGQYPRNAGLIVRSGQDPSGVTAKRGDVIHGIAQRLASFNPTPTESEHFLRVDVRALKPKENARSSSSEIAEMPLRKRMKMPPVRCKCELTIWNSSQNDKPQLPRFIQLLRDSQQCTITPVAANDGVSAAVHLDEAFFINVSKLLVPIRSSDGIRHLLGQNYRMQISLQPIAYNQSRWIEDWPPVPVESSETHSLDNPDCILHLDAKMNGFPATPLHGSLLELKYATHHGRPKVDTKYALLVEALWTKPQQTSTASQPLIHLHRNVPVLSTEMTRRSTNARVIYAFYLPDPVMAEPSTQTYQVLGYICPFCHGRDLQTSKLLQFHLVTDHDLFHFSFSEGGDRVEMARPRDLLVKVSDASREGRNNATNETDPWIWIQPPPTRLFNLEEYIDGDDCWVTGKKRKRFQENKRLVRKTPVPVSQIPDKKLVRDLPQKFKKRYRVPQAPPGGGFVSSLSKRMLKEGELLSETDDDVDETWLRKKHAKVIDSFTDLTETEKSFIKRWDDYMFEEKILSNRYVGDALVRFTRANRVWLQDPGILKEFFRHATKLILCNGVSHMAVQDCVRLIRGSDEKEEMSKCADTGRIPSESDVSRMPPQTDRGRLRSRSPDARSEDMSASSDAMDLDE